MQVVTNQYVGTELRIDEADTGRPATAEDLGGLRLPKAFQLQSAWARHKGMLLGQRWYLITDCEAEAGVLDTVGVADNRVFGDECMELLDAWAKVNGYTFECEAPLVYRRG